MSRKPTQRRSRDKESPLLNWLRAILVVKVVDKSFSWIVGLCLGSTLVWTSQAVNRRAARADFLEILGTKTLSHDSAAIGYAVLESSITNAVRYTTKLPVDNNRGLRGPDQVVALRDLLGITHLLRERDGLLANLELLPSDVLHNPSVLPDRALIAVGGPKVNVLTFAALNNTAASPLRFDTSQQWWGVEVTQAGMKFSTTNRDKLDYGFICRLPNSVSADKKQIICLFGISASGTEAACFYFMKESQDVRIHLATNSVIVLEVVAMDATRPRRVYP